MTEIGSLFMVGVYGRRATKGMVAHLKKMGATTILLLARNIDSPAQVRALTEELTQRLGRRLLFAIDHEGGWVTRFEGGVTCFPGNAALGRTRDPKLAKAVGAQMARELSYLGIGLNLAPVLDVVGSRYNPGIGIRSFGADAALVGRMGSAFISGIQGGGVAACAKHFPGKGAAVVDAHYQLPTIRLSRAELMRTHLRPFRDAVRSGVRCIMTSHVRYPAFGAEVATFSEKVVGGLIRDALGFKGVILSDDLCMGAVTASLTIPQAAEKALRAGHDMLIIAHDLKAQLEAVDAVAEMAARNTLLEIQLAGSGKKISTLFAKRPGGDRRVPWASGRRLSSEISRRAVAVVQKGNLRLPLKSAKSPILVLMPRLSEVTDRFAFDGGSRAAERLTRAMLSRWGRGQIKIVPVAADGIGDISRLIEKADRVVFFCFEAMRFAGQRAVLEALKKKAASKSVVCLLRNPWDASWLSPGMTAVGTYGYTLSQWTEALACIFGH